MKFLNGNKSTKAIKMTCPASAALCHSFTIARVSLTCLVVKCKREEEDVDNTQPTGGRRKEEETNSKSLKNTCDRYDYCAVCVWRRAFAYVRLCTGHRGRFAIVIGSSCLEGCGFDCHCRPDSFLRFNSPPVMYGTVGSLASYGVLGPSIWVQFPLEPLDLIV